MTENPKAYRNSERCFPETKQNIKTYEDIVRNKFWIAMLYLIFYMTISSLMKRHETTDVILLTIHRMHEKWISTETTSKLMLQIGDRWNLWDIMKKEGLLTFALTWHIEGNRSSGETVRNHKFVLMNCKAGTKW